MCDRVLDAGHLVVAVDDLSSGSPANLRDAEAAHSDLVFERLDIRSPEICDLMKDHDVDVVLHLAAQSAVAPSTADPGRDADINILGTIAVGQAAVQAGVKKIVFAASGGTLYGEPKRLPVREQDLNGAIPTTPYGISKKAGHDYLTHFAAAHALRASSLALANVYGPRQDPDGEAGVIAIFAQAMLEGKETRIHGDGRQRRDFVHVRDVAAAFSAAALAERSPELINIGTGQSTSIDQIWSDLARLTGYPSPKRFDAGARQGEVREIALEPSVARETLGWTPTVPLVEGLAETVSDLRTNRVAIA